MEVLGVWISAFLTLAVFSFLYRDNPIYKFAEHLFIGVSTGYILIQSLTGTLIPNLVHPLREAMAGGPWQNYLRLGALVLSVLLLLRLSGKAAWVSRWPLALMIGAYAALRMTGLAQSDLVEQVNATMVPVAGAGLPWFVWEGPSVVGHLVLVVGVVSVLIYFFFSVEQRTPLRQIGAVGTFFLMVTFGSSFGYTVLARISLLIGRAQDLYSFAEARYGYASIVCAILTVAFLAVWELRERRNRPKEMHTP